MSTVVGGTELQQTVCATHFQEGFSSWFALFIQLLLPRHLTVYSKYYSLLYGINAIFRLRGCAAK